ncbi:MAG: AMP-binding protein, partial [Planctomycetales bacterium]|nr:AMP-binding protein [Planctomycetales bacterium]
MKLPEQIASFDAPNLAAASALPLAHTKAKPSHWTATRLVDVLQSRARKHPDKLAFTFLEGGEPADQLTFGQLHQRARAIGSELRSRGAAGQPVMVVLEPGLRYVASLFGCFYAGSIAVPVYPPDPFRIARMLPRLQAIFSNAACELMIGDAATLGGADNAVRAMAKAAPVLVDDLPDAEPNWRPAAPPEEAPAILQYTSGTTGSAKGVAITHANLMYNMRALESLLDVDDAIALHWLPPYHDLGLIGGVLLPAFAGRETILMSPLDFMRNPAGWLKAMSRFGATTTASPNFGYELCLRKVTDADCEGLDLSRWRVAVSGAEPVRADTLDRFVERFGPYGFRAESFIPAYGMAETTLMVSVQGLDELPRRETFNANALLHHELAPCGEDDPNARTLVSCGRPGPQVEVKIINPESFEETDGVGEIWVRTPGVASGYWRRPVETEAAFDATTADGEKGWLRTGDLGFMSAGELFVTGRKKEMLILAGRNYYPQDIEAAVQEKHPALKRDGGAVVAVEIDNEERVAVFQEVQRPRKQNLEELLRMVRSTVAEEVGQEPHTVVLLANGEIPKTSSGKLQRSACWDAYQQGVLMTLLEWSQGESTASSATTDAPAETAPPEGEMEEWLSACWADVLGVEKVGREDNFIQLGGRSLQVIEMLQRVTEHTNRDLQLAAVFEHPTLAQFAAYIASAPELGEGATSLVSEYSLTADDESLPAAPNQHRFWLLDQLGVAQGGANVPLALAFEGPIDPARMQQALDVLVARHEALRARFQTNSEGELRQLIEPGAKLKLQTIELPAGETSVDALAAHDFAWSSIDTERAPLAKAAVVGPESDRPMLLLVLHHMVCDRAAANLLINDLAALYAGVQLPEVACPYHTAIALASQPIDEHHAEADRA